MIEFGATVDMGATLSLVAWISQEIGKTIALDAVWAAFAGGSLGGGARRIRIRTLRGSQDYVVAPYQGLSQIVPALDTSDAVDLVIHDLSGSRLSRARVGSDRAPSLVLASDPSTSKMALTLHADEAQLSQAEAMQFLDFLCGGWSLRSVLSSETSLHDVQDGPLYRREMAGASNGDRFDVINPADETKLASVASATEADGLAAVDAAHAAMKSWAAKHPRERSEILRRAFDLMTARRDEFARIITLENGKARADAIGEVTYAAEFFRWFSEEATRADGLLTRAPASGARILVHQKPAGVAVLVTPWNYPAAMGLGRSRLHWRQAAPSSSSPPPKRHLPCSRLCPFLRKPACPQVS